MSITAQEFAGLDLETAAAGLGRGDFTAADLLAAADARMDAFEPVINAVLTRNGAAEADAAAADAAPP
ncbi:MAG: amidase, partial [Planctomycetes bacterium]|nr:amidase [Planctomycetota bacterium]